jgi:hypothetical protein
MLKDFPNIVIQASFQMWFPQKTLSSFHFRKHFSKLKKPITKNKKFRKLPPLSYKNVLKINAQPFRNK